MWWPHRGARRSSPNVYGSHWNFESNGIEKRKEKTSKTILIRLRCPRVPFTRPATLFCVVRVLAVHGKPFSENAFPFFSLTVPRDYPTPVILSHRSMVGSTVRCRACVSILCRAFKIGVSMTNLRRFVRNSLRFFRTPGLGPLFCTIESHHIYFFTSRETEFSFHILYPFLSLRLQSITSYDANMLLASWLMVRRPKPVSLILSYTFF